MDRNDPEFLALSSRIQAYDFHKPHEPRSFAARVRQECGWSAAKADRVIAEYRRFLILAGACGHPVSPSPLVDAVWHLHLTDTRRYWGEFCPQVLGRPLHHDPSRGGGDERLKLDLQYEMTLAAYQRFFGEAAPADLWPADPHAGPLARLAVALKRPTLPAPLIAAPLLLAAAGCAAIVDSSQPGAIQGPEFLVLFGLTALAALMAMSLIQGLALRSGKRIDPAGLSAYELAYLAGGSRRVVQTALTNLYLNGHIALGPDGRTPVEAKPLPQDASAVDTQVMGAVRNGALAKRGGFRGGFPGLHARLIALGLLPGPKAARAAWTVFLLVMGALLAFGAVRLSFGLDNRRPVALLVLLMIITPIMGVVVTGMAVGGRGRVKALLERIRPNVPRTAETGDPMLLNSVALWGVAALIGVELLDFRHAANAASLAAVAPGGGWAGSGCSGGGGSCSGGGGCGGGGGGCGG